jgi:biopolymer transport protein ExbB/TolQ
MISLGRSAGKYLQTDRKVLLERAPMDAEFSKFLMWGLQVLTAVLWSVLWMNFRDLKSIAEANAKALADFKLHAAETYVTQSDLGKAIDAFNRSIDAVFAKLDRIEQKLDQKQDKPRT